ncbi:MAG: hypothetical protein NUW00_04630 [Candidatus Kaiserbacteria bacterium]|nr:hypothetical protein [Candidatus Kaiserbacteria bacterium]
MKQSVERTGPHETSWGIQAAVEEIDPQQLFVRDLLMERVGMSMEEATTYVKEIGVSVSATLKVLLQKSPDPVKHFRDFETSRNARVQ